MPVTSRELFEFSRWINTPDCQEVARRCAVSRAYYAALHTANDLFEKVKPAADGESSHAQIIGRVTAYSNQRQPGSMYASEIAKLLPRLRRLRNRADYDLDKSFEPAECNDALARVEFVLMKCDDVARMREAAGCGDRGEQNG